MFCELDKEMLCEKCLPKHAGIEHKKLLISDFTGSFPNVLDKKVKQTAKAIKNLERSKVG